MKILAHPLVTFTLMLLAPVTRAEEPGVLQREFVRDFLGLTKAESKVRIHLVPIGADAGAKSLYGRVRPDRNNEIELNESAFHEHPDDPGLRKEGTIVHELVHLYYYRHRPTEADWVHEGMAQLAEFLYDVERFGGRATYRSFLPLFHEALKGPMPSLTAFMPGSHADYGRTLLFFLFIHSTFQGQHFTRSHFRVAPTGLEGVATALRHSSTHALTPPEWKEPSTFLAQFYWSILNDRNTLATEPPREYRRQGFLSQADMA